MCNHQSHCIPASNAPGKTCLGMGTYWFGWVWDIWERRDIAYDQHGSFKSQFSLGSYGGYFGDCGLEKRYGRWLREVLAAQRRRARNRQARDTRKPTSSPSPAFDGKEDVLVSFVLLWQNTGKETDLEKKPLRKGFDWACSSWGIGSLMVEKV